MSYASQQLPSKLDTVLSAAALALSAGCAVAWLAGRNLPAEALFVRWGTFLMAVVVSGGLLQLLLARVNRQEREARLWLDRLGQRDICEVAASARESLPPLDDASPWHDTLLRVAGILELNAARLGEIEHARAATELRCRRYAAEHERLSNVLDGLAEAVIAVDPFDGLWLANRSAEQLLQLSADGSAKRELAQLAHCGKLVGLLNDAGRRKVRTRRTDEIELDVSGARRWHSVTTTSLPCGPASDPLKGEVQAGVVAVLRDISTQKALQRDHAEFVSAASHEMKTPLAGIKAYVELLAEGDAEDEDTRDEFLQIINGQADRLQRLIDNLLNLARIEAGVVQVSKQSQSLNDILLEAFRVVQPAAEAKDIQLANDLSPMYLGALVDRDMMLQAAINLLSNAIKYTPNEGRVTLRSRMLDAEVLFEVEDTGVGLGPEDCLRVFEKFYRVDSNKGMAPGTGLGLPLAKHIVEDVHGGRLSVTSTLGAGSTFRVAIPGSHRSS